MSTFPVPSPCILESGLISNDELTRARGDAKRRKVLVTKYMTRVVSPALCSRDDAEFQGAASKSLLGFGVAYHDLAPQRFSQGWDWLLPLLNVADWKLVKVWAFIRLIVVSGRQHGLGVVRMLRLCYSAPVVTSSTSLCCIHFTVALVPWLMSLIQT